MRKIRAPRKLTVCMLNYNGEQYLEESLASILAQREKFEEIILIDNASKDRSLEIVKNLSSSVKVIELNKNVGIAAGKNVGFKAAVCDRILFVDNDVSLNPECPDLLIQTLNDNPRAVIAMPRVLYAHDSNTIQYDGADIHFIGLMTLHNQNKTQDLSAKARKIGAVIGACFLIDHGKLGKGDPFDDTFFYAFDDLYFSVRTRSLGHEIFSVPSACCYHKEGTKGLSLRATGHYSSMRVYYTIRNRWQILLKTYQLRTLLTLSPMFFIYEMFQFVGVIKKRWFGEWFKAVTWILFHFTDIMRDRRIFQKSRTTPDREILQGGPIPFTHELTQTSIERTSIKCLNAIAVRYWNRASKFI